MLFFMQIPLPRILSVKCLHVHINTCTHTTLLENSDSSIKAQNRCLIIFSWTPSMPGKMHCSHCVSIALYTFYLASLIPLYYSTKFTLSGCPPHIHTHTHMHILLEVLKDTDCILFISKLQVPKT